MCNCTHGQIEAPDGTPEFCVQCVEGCDLELYRLVRKANGLLERIQQLQAKERTGQIAAWEVHELRGLQHDYQFVTTMHDRIEQHREALIEPMAVAA